MGCYVDVCDTLVKWSLPSWSFWTNQQCQSPRTLLGTSPCAQVPWPWKTASPVAGLGSNSCTPGPGSCAPFGARASISPPRVHRIAHYLEDFMRRNVFESVAEPPASKFLQQE